MAKKNKVASILKGIVGLGLIIFAVVPTPDDITIVSPVLAFTFGSKLLLESFI